MSLCKTILKKELYELELADIRDFFSDLQEESSVLEFKSGDVSLEMVHREVAAFLNTEGGLLILGAPREKIVKNIRVCTGQLTRCTTFSSQDTLMRSIASNISPTPTGIKAKSIIWEEGSVFILEIPQSVTPPHQVSNEGKYFIRLEREAKAAPHGIVEALFNKRQSPNLVGKLECFHNKAKNQLEVHFSLKNQAIVSAEKIGLLFDIYGVSKVKRHKGFTGNCKLIDDHFSVQELLENSLLVQGLSVSFFVCLELYKFPTLLTASYYCRDSKVKEIKLLGNRETGEEVKKYESDGTDYSEEEVQLINNEYYKSRENYVQSVLNQGKQVKFCDPAANERIWEIQDQLDIEFPDSFIVFLMVSNGYMGWFKEGFLELFSIEKIGEDNRGIYFNNDQSIRIGRLFDHQILIRASRDDDGNHEYSFLWHYAHRERFEELEFNTFFAFLQFIEDNYKV